MGKRTRATNNEESDRQSVKRQRTITSNDVAGESLRRSARIKNARAAATSKATAATSTTPVLKRKANSEEVDARSSKKQKTEQALTPVVPPAATKQPNTVKERKKATKPKVKAQPPRTQVSGDPILSTTDLNDANHDKTAEPHGSTTNTKIHGSRASTSINIALENEHQKTANAKGAAPTAEDDEPENSKRSSTVLSNEEAVKPAQLEGSSLRAMLAALTKGNLEKFAHSLGVGLNKQDTKASIISKLASAGLVISTHPPSAPGLTESEDGYRTFGLPEQQAAKENGRLADTSLEDLGPGIQAKPSDHPIAEVVVESPAVPAVVTESSAVPAVVTESPAVPAVVTESPAVPAVVAESLAVPAVVTGSPAVPAVEHHASSASHRVDEGDESVLVPMNSSQFLLFLDTQLHDTAPSRKLETQMSYWHSMAMKDVTYKPVIPSLDLKTTPDSPHTLNREVVGDLGFEEVFHAIAAVTEAMPDTHSIVDEMVWSNYAQIIQSGTGESPPKDTKSRIARPRKRLILPWAYSDVFQNRRATVEQKEDAKREAHQFLIVADIGRDLFNVNFAPQLRIYDSLPSIVGDDSTVASKRERQRVNDFVQDTIDMLRWYTYPQKKSNDQHVWLNPQSVLTTQQDGRYSGLHTMLNGWSVALGLEPAPSLNISEEQYRNSMIRARDVANLVLGGHMDAVTLSLFLQDIKWVKQNSVLKSAYRFAHTERMTPARLSRIHQRLLKNEKKLKDDDSLAKRAKALKKSVADLLPSEIAGRLSYGFQFQKEGLDFSTPRSKKDDSWQQLQDERAKELASSIAQPEPESGEEFDSLFDNELDLMDLDSLTDALSLEASKPTLSSTVTTSAQALDPAQPKAVAPSQHVNKTTAFKRPTNPFARIKALHPLPRKPAAPRPAAATVPTSQPAVLANTLRDISATATNPATPTPAEIAEKQRIDAMLRHNAAQIERREMVASGVNPYNPEQVAKYMQNKRWEREQQKNRAQTELLSKTVKTRLPRQDGVPQNQESLQDILTEEKRRVSGDGEVIRGEDGEHEEEKEV